MQYSSKKKLIAEIRYQRKDFDQSVIKHCYSTTNIWDVILKLLQICALSDKIFKLWTKCLRKFLSYELNVWENF